MKVFILFCNTYVVKQAPFEFVYRLEACLPINLHIPTLQIPQQFSIDKEALQGRIDQFMELDET
jgi:hypothetical protein